MTIITVPSTPAVGEYVLNSVVTPRNNDATQQRENTVTVATNDFDGQYQSLSDAITAIQNTGGTIQIKEGIYLEEDVIELPNVNISIIGQTGGNVEIIFKKVISSAYDTYLFDATDMESDLLIENLTLTSEVSGSYVSASALIGAYHYGSSESRSTSIGTLVINNCIFNGDLIRCVYVYESFDAIKIENCIFESGYIGIHLASALNYKGVNRITVNNNVFNFTPASASADMINCNIYYNISSLTNYPDVIFSGNIIKESSVEIYSRGGESLVCNNNSIYVSTSPIDSLRGITIGGFGGVSVVDNLLTFNGSYSGTVSRGGVLAIRIDSTISSEWGATTISGNKVTIIATDTRTYLASTRYCGILCSRGNIKVSNNQLRLLLTTSSSIGLSAEYLGIKVSGGFANISGNIIEMDDSLTTGSDKPTGVWVGSGNYNIVQGNTIDQATTGIDFTTTTNNIGDATDNIIA